MRASLQQIIPKTWLEWLVVVAIAVVLAALLLAQPKWAADGSIDVLVQVHVFDAETMRPIQGAFAVRCLLRESCSESIKSNSPERGR